jgi:isochorismate synthase EntC
LFFLIAGTLLRGRDEQEEDKIGQSLLKIRKGLHRVNTMISPDRPPARKILEFTPELRLSQKQKLSRKVSHLAGKFLGHVESGSVSGQENGEETHISPTIGDVKHLATGLAHGMKATATALGSGVAGGVSNVGHLGTSAAGALVDKGTTALNTTFDMAHRAEMSMIEHVGSKLEHQQQQRRRRGNKSDDNGPHSSLKKKKKVFPMEKGDTSNDACSPSSLAFPDQNQQLSADPGQRISALERTLKEILASVQTIQQNQQHQQQQQHSLPPVEARRHRPQLMI